MILDYDTALPTNQQYHSFMFATSAVVVIFTSTVLAVPSMVQPTVLSHSTVLPAPLACVYSQPSCVETPPTEPPTVLSLPTVLACVYSQPL